MLLVLSQVFSAADAPSATADPPVKVSIVVAPDTVPAGSEAGVTVQLEPKSGIKLNKYPKVKLQVPAVDGLVAAAEQAMGNAGPPPADQLDANYFHGSVDPLKLSVHMDAKAEKGRHELKGKLSYFYCVTTSGYCAPMKTEVTIPVTVR